MLYHYESLLIREIWDLVQMEHLWSCPLKLVSEVLGLVERGSTLWQIFLEGVFFMIGV